MVNRKFVYHSIYHWPDLKLVYSSSRGSNNNRDKKKQKDSLSQVGVRDWDQLEIQKLWKISLPKIFRQIQNPNNDLDVRSYNTGKVWTWENWPPSLTDTILEKIQFELDSENLWSKRNWPEGLRESDVGQCLNLYKNEWKSPSVSDPI